MTRKIILVDVCDCKTWVVIFHCVGGGCDDFVTRKSILVDVCDCKTWVVIFHQGPGIESV